MSNAAMLGGAGQATSGRAVVVVLVPLRGQLQTSKQLQTRKQQDSSSKFTKAIRQKITAAAAIQRDKEGLSAAQEELLRLQVTDEKPSYDTIATQVLVETAMFAAVGGLLYSIAAVLRLQGYMGYLLPLPIVLSAMRSGPRIALKTTTATCMLLLVLLGPLQAVTYLLTYGTAAWVMGSLWVLRSPWWLSVAVASLVRAASIISYLAFTSWTLNENVYRLLVNNIHSVVDWMGAMLGASGSPSPLVIQAVMVAALLVNCLVFMSMMHVLYAILLRQMGYTAMRMPRALERRLLPAQFHAAQQGQ